MSKNFFYNGKRYFFHEIVTVIDAATGKESEGALYEEIAPDGSGVRLEVREIKNFNSILESEKHCGETK